MKLTVLGGSAAGCNTGAGGSGYLVETSRGCIILDLGPGTFQELRKHTDFRMLDGIVISHLHVDHVLDLLALRFALAYNPIPAPAKIRLWLPPGGTDFLSRLARAFAADGNETEFFSTVLDVAEYDPESTLCVGNVEITFAPTAHYVPCWAMRVSAAGAGSLFYSADTGPAVDLKSLAAGCSVGIIEATLLEPSNEPFAERGHLTAAEAGAFAQRALIGVLVLSHLWEERGFDAYRQLAAHEFRGQLELAAPGLTVEW